MPAPRPAARVERVSRAFQAARSSAWKAWGAPSFEATGSVQIPEQRGDRPGRVSVALAYSRKAAVRFSRSPPGALGDERTPQLLYSV